MFYVYNGSPFVCTCWTHSKLHNAVTQRCAGAALTVRVLLFIIRVTLKNVILIYLSEILFFFVLTIYKEHIRYTYPSSKLCLFSILSFIL